MTTIGHLFDESTAWEQRVAVGQLVDRLPSDRFRQVVAITSPAAKQQLNGLNRPVQSFSRVDSLPMLAGPSVARFASDRSVDLIHAWGVRAAVTARTLADTPLVVHLFDPCVAVRHVKRLRTLARARGFAVVCSCEIARRRLVEGGLPYDQTVVIRPGVDFAAINQFRRSGLRERLGLTGGQRVLILPEDPDGRAGSFEAFQAVALRQTLQRDLRVIVPGSGIEPRRIARFAATLPPPSALVATDNRFPFEQLITVADALLITPRGDAPTGAIAWAMGAGVSVVGTAVHCVAELIASRVNGLLFKQTPGKSMAMPILGLLKDEAAMKQAKEAARGQAYEVFGIRRCIDQHIRVYENILAGARPADGITDPAMTG